MKKYTNKILLLTLLAFTVVSGIVITILIQHANRVHPEFFHPVEDKSVQKALPVGSGSDTVAIVKPGQIDTTDINNL